MKIKELLFVIYVAASVSFFVSVGFYPLAGLGILTLIAQLFELRTVKAEEKRMLEKLKDLFDPTKP